jgi:hypothetical protein
MIRLVQALLLLSFIFLTACEDPTIAPAIEARRAAIAMEPRGDWFIGRRFYIERTQFWGYLRRPGQSWESSRLVIMNEKQMKQPDRVFEEPKDFSPKHGYDHNHEYKIWGRFTGRTIYDPNSDLFLPEFVLTKWELVNPRPGWLFKPKEKFNGEQLLRWEKGDESMRGTL